MTAPEIVDAISKGGALVIAVYAILAFMNGWIVPGKAHAEMKTDCKDQKKELQGRLDAAAAMATKSAEANAETIRVLNATIARFEAKS